ATLFVCAALLVPASYAPLAAGLFWGACLGGLLILVRQRRPAQRLAGQTSPPSTQIMRDTLTGALLLASVGWIGTPVAAAPADEAAKLAATKTYRVVIPLNADRQPTGDYVYVPLDFYTLLYRAPERPELPAWLLRSVTYEVETPPEKAAASIVTMRTEIENMAEKAKISLPLRRGEVHLPE